MRQKSDGSRALRACSMPGAPCAADVKPFVRSVWPSPTLSGASGIITPRNTIRPWPRVSLRKWAWPVILTVAPGAADATPPVRKESACSARSTRRASCGRNYHGHQTYFVSCRSAVGHSRRARLTKRHCCRTPSALLALAIALAAPEHYASNGLYEYIDGGADVYIEAGLKSCTVRRYGGHGNKGAEFEVALFTMAAPVNAFGLFRQLHETRTRALGTESAAEPLRVSFWKSSVYAEVIDKSSKPVPDSTLWSLAKTVAGRMPGDTLLARRTPPPPPRRQDAGQRAIPENRFSLPVLSRQRDLCPVSLRNVRLHALCHDLRVGQRGRNEAQDHRQGIRRRQSARPRVRVPQPRCRVRGMRAEGIRGHMVRRSAGTAA